MKRLLCGLILLAAVLLGSGISTSDPITFNAPPGGNNSGQIGPDGLTFTSQVDAYHRNVIAVTASGVYVEEQTWSGWFWYPTIRTNLTARDGLQHY